MNKQEIEALNILTDIICKAEVERIVFSEDGLTIFVDSSVNEFINWCKEEYCQYEGCDLYDLRNCITPKDYANKVYSAWTDYCYNTGLI